MSRPHWLISKKIKSSVVHNTNVQKEEGLALNMSRKKAQLGVRLTIPNTIKQGITHFTGFLGQFEKSYRHNYCNYLSTLIPHRNIDLFPKLLSLKESSN
jgi:hypothetical protein